MTDLTHQLLDTAKDIVLLEKAGDNWRFAAPFVGDLAKTSYEATLNMNNSLPEFQSYWKFNEQTGQINGSSIPHLARLSRFLRPLGLKLPDTLDYLTLEKEGKLKSGVYRDSGVAVYSDDSPNKETAKVLIEKARQESRELPLLWSPEDLDYAVSKGHAKIISIDKPKRVISGADVIKVLEKFYKADSGARGVYQGRCGGWGANWGDFAGSYSNCLVDWVCAEGTRENLQKVYINLMKMQYGSKIKKLEEQKAGLQGKIDSEIEAFLQKLKA